MKKSTGQKKALRRLHHLSARPRRVEVEWIDSTSQPGWVDATDVLDLVDRGDDALRCWTVGYLLDEAETSITVAPSFTIDPRTGLHDEYGDAMTIPRSSIREMHDLRR